MDIADGTLPAARSLIFGVFVSLTLFGVNLTQCTRYFHYYSGENIRIDTLAVWMVVLEIAQTIFLGCMISEGFFSTFGDPQSGMLLALQYHRYSGLASSATAFSTQLFFCYRFYILSGYTWLSIIAVIFSITKTVGYFVTTIHAIVRPSATSEVTRWLWCAIGILSVLTHVVISSGLYLLYRRREHEMGLLGPSYLRFIRPIDRVILRCIQADVLPTLFTMINMIMFLAPKYNVWLSLSVITARLYTLSFFTSLLYIKSISLEVQTMPDADLLQSSTTSMVAFPMPPASIFSGALESEYSHQSSPGRIV